MAKLTARGRRTEVTATREYTEDQLIARAATHGFLDSDGKALTIWERRTRRLMSDGTILEKVDVRFHPDWLDKDGRRHSYGWKVHGKLKPGLTSDDFARIYAADTKSGHPSPWTVTRGESGPPHAVISRTRLMNAIQRDEMTGFCTSCGAEQSPVEPDANSYQCESCGQHAVCGAENLLMELV